MRHILGGLGFVGVLLSSTVAFAQEEEMQEEEAPEASDVAEATEPVEEPAEEETSSASDDGRSAEELPSEDAAGKSSKEGADGVRFRFGVSGGGGILTASGVTLKYGGMDMRFGAQISDLIAVYAQPQLGFYGANVAGFPAVGGLIGGSVVADVTLIDHFFVGAGAGYAVLNNPSGPELHLRAGGYPLMGRSKEKVRRKGLMVGADLRFHFVEGYTFIAPTLSLGYEAF